MNKLQEKVMQGLTCCMRENNTNLCGACPYHDVGYTFGCMQSVMRDALYIINAQNEVIMDLRKVGYPHNFEHHEPWIADYMNLITEVIKKAVRLSNG